MLCPDVGPCAVSALGHAFGFRYPAGANGQPAVVSHDIVTADFSIMSLRPAILDPLFAPASSLPGVGPKVALALDRLLGEAGAPARVVDLLLHLPNGALKRELMGSIAEAPAGVPGDARGSGHGLSPRDVQSGAACRFGCWWRTIAAM